MLDLPALLANKSEAQLKAELEHLLAAHTLPVFGAAKQVEHEVAALRALKMLGALPDNADEYTLVTTLRITKTKARNLLYQDALHTLTSPQQIDDALRALVMQPTATKDDDLIVLKVPQPFLINWSTLAFIKPNEKSVQARYDADFAAWGAPGLKLMTRYIKGSDAKRAGNLDDISELERNFLVSYVVQSGPLKDVGLTWFNIMAKTQSGNQFDENRLILTYTVSIW